jgi:polar amino acid transport system substrate-binding protein
MRSAASFVNDKMEALASLRPWLVTEAAKLSGSRILEGKFAAVQQAVGVNKGNEAAYAWLKAFVEASKANGLVASLIEHLACKGNSRWRHSHKSGALKR